ncbi:MAG: aminotransferase class III-fold pyridoxal phosphate-dependent enzyme [Planctomycetota bacterium]
MEREPICELENRFSFNVYPKREVVITEGRGALLFGPSGERYIDCAGGHGVAAVGHGNEKVAHAIASQAKRLISCPGVFYNDMRAQFLEKLLGFAPEQMINAFLCNSGAESIEAALKFARFTTKRTDVVCAMRGFHGRTMGALSATGTPAYRELFEPLVQGFSFAPFNHIERMDALINDRTAAVLIEPVQGEGGVHVGENDFFQKLRELCTQRGALLIVDEVQTGFCRTGRRFGHEHFDIKPDMICLAKAMAGGVPMGAVLCAASIESPLGKHGSTFGGNPLACAAGLATIDFMLENNLAREAERKGRLFMEMMRSVALPRVRQIRGLGLMIGIELKEKVRPVLTALAEEGVLALPAGSTVLRLLPPLVISDEELLTAGEKIIKVLSSAIE